MAPLARTASLHVILFRFWYLNAENVNPQNRSNLRPVTEHLLLKTNVGVKETAKYLEKYLNEVLLLLPSWTWNVALLPMTMLQ